MNLYRQQYTPLAIFRQIEDLNNLLSLSKKIFDNRPVFIKDYVKSKSSYPDASFISDGENIKTMESAITKLKELRGKEFNIGIVIKEQIEIAKNEKNEKIEFRAFVINDHLIDIFKRFDDDRINNGVTDTKLLNALICEIKNKLSKFSNFYTIDIVLKKDNTFSVMEVGDGQVSGIPEHEGYFDLFYENLLSSYQQEGLDQ